MIQRKMFLNAMLALCAALMLVATASAEITTRVDRPSVDLNESFVLEIAADAFVDKEPDLSVLDENFYRGQLSQLSNTSIVNGQIRRTRTWTIALMAKQAGKQEIPGITVGKDKSAAIAITINEPTHAPPGEADVFISSEVDQTEVYVQSQVLYRYRVYKAVPTRQDSGRDPSFSGVEVLFERAGNERRYDAILNGKAYNVIEQVLAIYPQASGEISISPARFEARVLKDGRITGRKVFESKSHTIKVLPIPAPPADYLDAAWLPAKDVTLSEEWSREPDRIAAGEPLTRKVSIRVLGQIETQIPALDPPEIDGMNVYADKPDLSREFAAEGIRGIRRDQYALIGTRGGAVVIPQLEVPWWNVEAGEWQIARLAARTIDIKTPLVVAAPTEVAMTAVALGDAAESQNDAVADGFWRLVSQMLVGLWLLTMVAWWWSGRERSQNTKEPEPPPIYKQQAKFVKAARKAATSGDKPALRAALIEWGRLQWSDDAPRNIGDFAARVTAPLSDELRGLSATSYGAGDGEWNGDAMAKLLRSIKLLHEEGIDKKEDLLPLLMPPSN